MAKPTDQQSARASFIALVHVAWLRYLTHLELTEVRAAMKLGPQPDEAWKLKAAQDAFRITASMFPADDPFRMALESYAADELPKMRSDSGSAPPPPPDTLWN